MAWTNNLIEYLKTDNVGVCPKCKNDKVKVEEFKHRDKVSISFSCEKCGSFEHFDGASKK